MNVFYEEDGGFKVASVMAENPGSLQVESASGKRSKIKTANVLLKFEGALAGFMEQAQAEAEKLAPDFLWECCGEEEFSFENLARDYHGRAPASGEAAAMAIALHAAPMYFYRKGKGRYKAAPEDSLKAALAAQERKRLQAEKVAAYVARLTARELPPEFRDKLDMLLYAPDKNALEWKALDEAATNLNLNPLKLLESCGALSSAHDYHFGAFLREYFPAGAQFETHEPVLSPDDLPAAETEAFSIDDATTTEIDDALSVKTLADGNTRIGIHIAAPALGIAPGGGLDAIVMKRLSTVYMPGQKITMLPEAVITPFSLNAGTWRPALSLYVDIAPDFSVVAQASRLENVKIADNLSHDALEPHFNESNWETTSDYAYWERLALLHRFAEAQEKSRGKYDPNKPPQVDYNFNVEDGKIRITERKRGAPMDKLVSELMIHANAHWGGLLAENTIPGIYRAQTGGKVYMTVNAEPHQGLGVAQYAWNTSPLRRAVDLINQRQMIALLQGAEPVYAKGGDALVGAMRDFDLTYNAYGEFQTRMERHWCLVYLQQENIREIGAIVWRENLVRLDGMPYFTKVHSLPELAPGSHVLLEVKRIDPLLMELDCRYKGMLE
ncbi:MAG: RNB domain-containing ribonuclease [Methylobacillus sp.]|jgi:exoribonuclease-2|nr:RNB domain-containing ribonuclease [Methylobacillus sp.]